MNVSALFPLTSDAYEVPAEPTPFARFVRDNHLDVDDLGTLAALDPRVAAGSRSIVRRWLTEEPGSGFELVQLIVAEAARYLLGDSSIAPREIFGPDFSVSSRTIQRWNEFQAWIHRHGFWTPDGIGAATARELRAKYDRQLDIALDDYRVCDWCRKSYPERGGHACTK